MQLLQAERTYDELIQHMRENGYSESYLDQIEKEICWIEKNQKTHHFASYEEACLARCLQMSSTFLHDLVIRT